MPDYTQMLRGEQQSQDQPGNPYLSVLESEEQARQQQFRASVEAAVDVNPDKLSAQRRVAGYLGYPTEAVEALPQETERQAKVKRIDQDTAAAPVLRQRFTDADFARLAHDDTESLSSIEALFGALKSGAKYVTSAPDAPRGGLVSDVGKAGRALLSAVPQAGSGLYGVGASFAGLADQYVQAIDDAAAFLTNTPRRQIVGTPGAESWLLRQQQLSAGLADQVADNDPNAGFIERSVLSGVQSAGQSLLTLPLGLAGKAEAMLAAMGLITGGQSYGKGRESGLSPAQAAAFASQDAIAEVVTERYLGAGGLLDRVKAGASASRLFAYELFKEVPGEMGATLWQNFNEWANVNPEKSLAQFVSEQPEALLQTVIATLVGGSVQIGTIKSVEKAIGREPELQRQADQAEQHADAVEKILEAAQASKTMGRDVSTFEGFAQSLAQESVPEVYVSTEALAPALEQIAQVAPEIAERIANAVPGADVAIPTESFVGKLAQAGISQTLVDDIRTSEDAMTRREAQEFMKEQGDRITKQVEQTLAQNELDAEMRRSRDDVKQSVLDALNQVNRFRSEVNEQYANLVASFMATQAARVGTTPQEMLQRYPLQVVTQGVAGLDQPAGNPVALAKDTKESTTYNILNAGGEPIGTVWIRKRVTSAGDELIDVDQFHNVGIDVESEKGKGYGIAAYTHLIDKALSEGRQAWSDPSVSPEAQRIYDALKRRGYKVEENASRPPVREDDGTLVSRGSYVYRVTDGPAPVSGGSLGQEQNAAFDPETLTIALMKSANFSSFVHEAGHFFLTVEADLAARIEGQIRDGAAVSDGERQILEDTNKLLDWMGIKATAEASALTVWHSMSLDEQRRAHEQFAESFERYAIEGKAPSQDLQGTFQRFRAWLLSVYRGLKQMLAQRPQAEQLNDDVRSIMDRMLAADDEIRQMQTVREMGALFTGDNEKLIGNFEAYHALGEKATQDAIDTLQSRSLRDMKWLTGAKARLLKKLQADAAEKRKAVERDVRAEVMSQPVYQAWQYLTARAADDTALNADAEMAAFGRGRLRTDDLREMYGTADDAVWRRLSALGMTSDRVGIAEHPDIVAERFGFTSGDELVQALDAAAKPDDAVRAAADRRMLELYGDITNPQEMERAADEALHNEARLRFVATELAALQKARNVRMQTGTDKNGRAITADALVQAAKQYAQDVVSRTKVKDLRPGVFTRAETAAAVRARDAMDSGKIEEAAQAKRDQVINSAAARETMRAQDEVKKARDYFQRVNGSKSIDIDYREQIDAILERFDLRQMSNKDVERRRSLADWIKSQQDIGLEPDLPADVLNEAFRRPFKDLTVDEVRGLRDSIKQIEHLGRLKAKLLTAKDTRDFETIRDDLADSIVENAGDRKADIRTPTTATGRWLANVKAFGAAHIKAATWARILDGGKDGGPMWEHLIRPANEAGNRETAMRADATKALTQIMAPVLKKKLGGKGVYFASVDRSLNLQQRIAIALNVGNESNLQRLLGGEGWDVRQIQPILDSLTTDEAEVVQAVWDHFESYRPMVEEQERRVYGREFNAVTPTPVIVGGKLLKGGYYPIKYDTAASVRAEEHADAEGARRQLQGAYGAATVRRSFTKARVDEVVGRPLLYSLSGVYQGVNETIHALAWGEWLIDVNRLLKSDKIDKAIREHYGPEAVRQFKTWRDAIAEGEKAVNGALDQSLGWVRRSVSAAGLSFNLMSALKQPLGITQSIVRVGAPWIGRGVAQYIGSPVAKTREVNAKSAFMTNRARTRFRELNELRNQVEGQTAFKEWLGTYGYFLMMRFQQMVDVPTWLGAYEKAIAEGNAEDRAVALADQAVIDAQGGGQTKDLSAIEMGGQAQRLFTVFYSFMNTALNLGVAQTMTPRSRAKLAVDYLLLYSVPAILGVAITDALTPGDSGDWDDWEKLLKKLAAEQIGFLMGLMVVVREFAEAGKTAAGVAERPRDYSGPAGVRMVSDVGSFAKQAGQGEFDDAFRKASINLLGDLTGVPSAQINRTITGINALSDDKTDNPAAVLLGYQEPR